MCDTYRRREVITLERGTIYKPVTSIQNVISFKILKIMANNAFYNVIQGVNDIFQWTDNGGASRNCAVPQGQYDHLSFAAAWENACNAVGAETFTITFDLSTKKYNINTNLAIRPRWVSGSTSAFNISRIAGYWNDTTGNETLSTNHTSNYPAQLIPSHYLLKSTDLAGGRKSSGGGGGTQLLINGRSPQNYITTIPNQVDGSYSTFIYRTNDDDNETFDFNAPRQISEFDLEIVHPYYTEIGQSDKFYSIYSPITYEIEFICLKRYK